MEWIWIPIPVSLPEDQDSNLKGMDSNPNSKKGQEGLLEEVDSNPHELDSNLDFSKFAWMVGLNLHLTDSNL